MKKEYIRIEVDSEKVRALNFHLSKRDMKAEDALRSAFDRLYEKVVPAPTREYIDSKCAQDAQPTARSRIRKAAQSEARPDAGQKGEGGETDGGPRHESVDQ